MCMFLFLYFFKTFYAKVFFTCQSSLLSESTMIRTLKFVIFCSIFNVLNVIMFFEHLNYVKQYGYKQLCELCIL